MTYNGDRTNLHAIWDTQIPEAISDGSSLADAKAWATTLTTGESLLALRVPMAQSLALLIMPCAQKAISTGEYSSLAAGWVSGLSIANAQTTATKWASESNAAVCSTVLRQGVAFVEDNDLGGSYTTSASPIVKLQIAKQGYR